MSDTLARAHTHTHSGQQCMCTVQLWHIWCVEDMFLQVAHSLPSLLLMNLIAPNTKDARWNTSQAPNKSFIYGPVLPFSERMQWTLAGSSLSRRFVRARRGGGTPRGKMEWDHFKVWKHIHRIFKRNPKCCLTVEWKRKPLWGTFAKLHTRCVSALLTNARACKLLSTVGRAGRTSHAFFFALCWHLIAFTPTSFSH